MTFFRFILRELAREVLDTFIFLAAVATIWLWGPPALVASWLGKLWSRYRRADER
jgi:hypothetical protein